MKRFLKKLMALLLSIAIVLPMCVGLVPRAMAAGTAVPGEGGDFSDQGQTGRPNLYVDFLGDNAGHNLTGGTDPGNLLDPTFESYAAEDHAMPDSKYWDKYESDDVTPAPSRTIFWVGVGIDQITALKLLEDDDAGKSGLYSAEVGFYYNSDYIEPYVDSSGSFQSTIKAANITSYPTQMWGENFEIIDAQTGLDPQTEGVTAEIIGGSGEPEDIGMGMIMGADAGAPALNPWKMTYVSVERKTIDPKDNRFEGEYDPDTDAPDTKYLFIIPFVLKGYDSDWRLCLRLARNATHFSIGGGGDGTEVYAAWERMTERNPGHSLKLMANFTGDLNIFTGKTVPDSLYTAKVEADTRSNPQNAATLTITNDPSPTPVSAWIGTKMEPTILPVAEASIDGLAGGVAMTLDVSCATGFKVKVTVTYTGVMPEVEVYTIVVEPKVKYTFIMPEHNVTIKIEFEPDGATDFMTWLVENRDGEENIPDTETTRIPGNYARITYPDGGTEPYIDSDTVPSGSDLWPSIIMQSGTNALLRVDLHPDYEAIVRIRTLGATTADVSVTTPLGVAQNGDGDYIVSSTVATGWTFTTQQRDIQVLVTYRLAETKTARLEVHHVNPIEDAPASGIYPDLERNVAQLSYPAYQTHDSALPTQVYSGVVYNENWGKAAPDPDEENNSAIEAGVPRILTRIAQTAAAESKALGGDGVLTPLVWDINPTGAFMMKLFDAATVAIADLPAITAFDLKDWGIRKNAAGDYFTSAAEVDAFKTQLLALRDLAQLETPPEDILTLAQVQAYLVDCANHEADPTAYPTPAAWKDDATASAQIVALDWPALGRKMDAAPWPVGEAAPSADAPHSVETRPGRKMTLTLETTSYYTVSEIRLIDKDTTSGIADVVVYPAATGGDNANRDGTMQNVYRFDMPEYDCTVKVTYTPRALNSVRLVTTGIAAGATGNAASLTVHNPQTSGGTQFGLPSAVATETSTANATKILDNVLVGSTVSGKVVVAAGYTATVTVYRMTGGGIITTNPLAIGTLTGGTTTPFTFVVPGNVDPSDEYVQVAVSFTAAAATPKTATLVWSHDGTADYANEAGWMTYNSGGGTWTATSDTVRTAAQNDIMRAQVTVVPGYYIQSVNVVAAGISYPYTLSGNGYNGGAGGDVYIDLLMPPENTTVYIIFKPGPAPVEPEYTMRVIVNDEKASAPLSTVNFSVAGGPGTLLDKTNASAAAPWATYVSAGKEVLLDLTVQTGYYIESITVTPAALGVVWEWDAAGRVRLTAPAGDSLITVNIKAGTSPLHYLQLAVTQVGGPAQTDNRVVSVNSNSLAGDYPTRLLMDTPWEQVPRITIDGGGAAKADETVKLNILVQPGWYVDSVTLWGTAGGVPVTLSENGYNGGAGAPTTPIVATFQMPNSEAWAVVNYRRGSPPTAPSEHSVTLLVTDPDNTTDGTALWVPADNWANAAISGSTTAAIPKMPPAPSDKLGLKYPQLPWTTGTGTALGPVYDVGFATFGDEVLITYGVETGFHMEIIVVTPGGLNIVPTYLSGSQAKFTMPKAPVMVEVRFRAGDPLQYRADLTIRPPAGATAEDVGAATFDVPGANLSGGQVYSINAEAGERVDLALFAADGYYIRAVEVNPASLGVAVVYTGAFGLQSGYFIMPAGNVQVNVFYEKAWPDEAHYGLTLAVTDPFRAAAPTTADSSYGRLSTVADVPVVGAVDVFGGGRQSIASVAMDRDEVFVQIAAVAGVYIEEITVTTPSGDSVEWQYAVRETAPGTWISGIEFTVPAANVTVAVRFGNTAPPQFKIDAAVTMIAGDGAVTVQEHSGAGTPAPSVTLNDITPGGTISNIAVGTRVSVNITPPPTGRAVLAAWAVDTVSGRQLIFPATQVAQGGTVNFAMPEGDVEVHVLYGIGPDTGEYPATLTVSGPTAAGAAKMETTAAPTATTGTISVGQSGSLFAQQGIELMVTVNPTATHYIERVEVRDGAGNLLPFAWQSGSYTGGPPAVWTDNVDKQFTFTMPANAAHVHVVLAEIPPASFTAQLVVNDSAYVGGGTSANDAKLVRATGVDSADTDRRIPNLAAGDRVYLDIAVMPGYKIESILVVSARHGINLPLSLALTADQRTAFDMPSDDVVVYIKFVTDGAIRYNAKLEVVNPMGNPGNEATIYSDYSGLKGPISSGSVTVAAVAGVEWVTVKYDSAVGEYADVTVLDGDGNPVPFTQVAMLETGVTVGELTFPMVSRPVTVTVTYVTTEPGFDLNLHVIDLTSGGTADTSWAQLLWRTEDTTAITAGQPENNAIIQVPAGAEVTLNAEAVGTSNYIQAAYVLYEAGGQMIELNLDADASPDVGFSGPKSKNFIMHPGTCDVYVYFTDKVPTVTERAVVLMVSGPTTDTGSFGQMWSGAYDADSVVTAYTNQAHAYLTSEADERITVQMTLKDGLVIDSILLTPLGIAVVPTRSGDTYTFIMPAENMAVHIKLREGNAGEYSATLHLGGTLTAGDAGQISAVLPSGTTVMTQMNGGVIIVPENETVDVKVRLDQPPNGHLILAAYVMQGAEMIPLSANIEGTMAGASIADAMAFDAEVTFTMPSGDVDVYLWFTATPPSLIPWYTTVLTVTDVNNKGVKNLGYNSGTIEGETSGLNTPAQLAVSDGSHAFVTVVGDEKITVTANPPANGYVFAWEAMTTSPGGMPPPLTGGPPPATYTFTMPTLGHNAAVELHYASAVLPVGNLEVVVEDGDNPGNGTIANTVEVFPDGKTPLTLQSVGPTGAWQVIPGVLQYDVVDIEITPQAGYYPVALLEHGATTTPIALTPLPETSPPDGSTVYKGSIIMPDATAAATTIRVMLYKAYEAKLTLVELGDPGGSFAHMTESAFGGTVNVDADQTTDAFPALPNTTVLRTTPTAGADSEVLAVLATTPDGSTQILPLVDGAYPHTISRKDVEVKVITAKDDGYFIAAAQMVNAPVGADVSIANTTTSDAGQSTWVAANVGNAITLTVDVPAGYRADITDDAGIGLASPILPSGAPSSFTMPGSNVNVTVTFVKTSMTVTLVAVGATAGDAATLDTLAVNATTTTDMLTGVTAGTTLNYVATPDPASVVSAILLTAGGSTTPQTVPFGSVVVGNEDVIVAVIFRSTTVVPPDEIPYIASVATENTGGLPGNAAMQIINQTNTLPGGMNWAQGYANDGMKFTFTTEPGYYAEVTATIAGTTTTVPVVQQGVTGTGTAYVDMPANDVEITVTFSDVPPTDTYDLTLKLVDADGQPGNKGSLLYSGGPLTVTGDESPPQKSAANVAVLGGQLRISADWAADYAIVKITMVIDGTEQTLPFNRYGTNASAMLTMPSEDAEVCVYYGKLYTATLNIVGAATGDTAEMEELISMQTANTHGDQIVNLAGGETITVTATPGADRRVVGVLLTDSTGVQSVPVTTLPAYAFAMPEDDVIVTVVFEDEPTAGDPVSHIAKIQYHEDSDGQTESGNAVEIKNSTDAAAPDGPLWAAGVKDDRMTVTVFVADGYQAVITSVRNDSSPIDDIYINRITFLPTTTGKEAVFTMPDDDVTVVIKFIRGYTARLELVDLTTALNHTAALVDAPETTLIDAVGPTTFGDPVVYTATEMPGGTVMVSGEDTIRDLFVTATDPIALEVDTQTVHATDETAKILTTTPTSGTVDMTPVLPDTLPIDFWMPMENLVTTVLLRDESDQNKLLAKVQLEGESDVVGNSGGIEDIEPTLPNGTTVGTIWTTTQETHLIEVKLTIAKGYRAEVQVFADSDLTTPLVDKLFTDSGLTLPSADPELLGLAYQVPTSGTNPFISDEQTCYFAMITEDVTVVITFFEAAENPRPFDPTRAAIDDGATPPVVVVEAGHIYGVNRKDYADVTIPTLTPDDGATLYDANTASFEFALFDPSDPTAGYTPLLEGTDVLLVPVDPENTTDPYDYDTYYAASGTDYIGARFKLIPANGALGGGAAFAAMLDNDGSLDAGGRTQLYVRAVDKVTGEESEYTEVVIRQYYTLTGRVNSYAPQKEGLVELYALKSSGTPDRFVVDGYDTTAVVLAGTYSHTTGTGLWQMSFEIHSSELVGGDPSAPGYTPPTFMLRITKPAHMPYERVNLTMDINDPAYDAATRTFTIEDVIKLRAGDLNWDGAINLMDRSYLLDFINRRSPWSRAMSAADSDWDISVYNIAYMAYWCDIDGDGYLDTGDLSILMAPGHYGSLSKAYQWYDPDANGGLGGLVLPNGFAPGAAVTATLLSAPVLLMTDDADALPGEPSAETPEAPVSEDEGEGELAPPAPGDEPPAPRPPEEEALLPPPEEETAALPPPEQIETESYQSTNDPLGTAH